ncbi:haloacid dehalogenase-like hydrolase [Lentzea sp. PSKA42]|uniref:Haloacid dehalogenase-like hydrolase n=1 Tax=Lentzea indica TaxID=2604800 RepID=A0ABX1FI36_9PSEU|nr:haloacid dehalogenase-like hydrolase [Lentzea indica]NKE58623.1 haloacid dehalogenase-like hydrolase [Lentzea indica]
MRILDLDRTGLAALRGQELSRAVAASEGRTMVAEVFADRAALSFDGQTGVHNAELMAAFGADVIVLNMIDRVWDGTTFRFPGLGELGSLGELASKIGRPIGVNLEPGTVPELRKATRANAQRLADAGAALIVLTANPSTDGSLDGMAKATEQIRTDAALWVGKMHHAGHPEPITAQKLVNLVDAGADGVILPLPGTLPGVTREAAAEAVQAVHEKGAVVMGAIGTSQEGSHTNVVPQLALTAKEIGVDAHHIGDCFLPGMGDPELLYAYSVAIRGRRHTWTRMAR